eukprot:snap_masked-scaffold_7-processed-gene-16.25-mRNA-1 protein AED:1.00 eAED:1.00 QI:0/0/0/0/1/1/3/0/83
MTLRWTQALPDFSSSILIQIENNEKIISLRQRDIVYLLLLRAESTSHIILAPTKYLILKKKFVQPCVFSVYMIRMRALNPRKD